MHGIVNISGLQLPNWDIRMVFPSPKVHVFQYIFPVVAHRRYMVKITGKEHNHSIIIINNNNNKVFIYCLVFSI